MCTGHRQIQFACGCIYNWFNKQCSLHPTKHSYQEIHLPNRPYQLCNKALQTRRTCTDFYDNEEAAGELKLPWICENCPTAYHRIVRDTF